MADKIMSKNEQIDYRYTAEEYPLKTDDKNDEYLKKLQIYCPYPYLPSDDLKEAVNLAIALERPLLLEGEPGCGKTRLAGAVAYEFTKKNQDFLQEEKWWDYYIWNIKSTTRARDGLYRYDAVRRLRDAQLMGTDPDKLNELLGEDFKKLQERLKDKKEYRRFEPLGQALGGDKKHSYRPILLIDEIDKADSDFANDLLLELEELRFEIPETGEQIDSPDHKPIIFITSNREKPLPEPFLRRCIYFYIDFPASNELKKIINKRFNSNSMITRDEIVNEALNRFYEIRQELKDHPGSKPPGTSELIDFLNSLSKRKEKDKKSNEELTDLNDLFKRTAYLGTLLKSKQDRDLISSKFKNRKE